MYNAVNPYVIQIYNMSRALLKATCQHELLGLMVFIFCLLETCLLEYSLLDNLLLGKAALD